jgi:hypothetical protein
MYCECEGDMDKIIDSVMCATVEDEIHCLQQCPILNLFRTEAMQQISDICKHFASLDNKSKIIWLIFRFKF